MGKPSTIWKEHFILFRNGGHWELILCR